MLQQKGIDPAAIQWDQSLHEMIAIEYRMVIGGRKLVESLHPQLRCKTKLRAITQGNCLDLRVCIRSKNGSKDRLQLIYAAAEEVEHLFLARRDAVCR